MGWPDEPFLNLRQTTTPNGSAPNGGQLVYVKSDGKLYTKIAGVETVLGAGGDVTLTGVQTLTNKTLTSPVIDTILGANGLTAASFASVASAVNWIQIANNVATGAARLIAQGSDTNISINIVPKGTGTLKQNGVDVLTTTGTQTVTNKTLSTGTLVGSATTDLSGSWATFTPTVTAGTGTFTTVSAALRYMQLGKTVHWNCVITITTVGTAAGVVNFTLPVAVSATPTIAHIGSGRENALTGKALQVYRGATTASVLNYDNTSAIAAGASLLLSGTYEAA